MKRLTASTRARCRWSILHGARPAIAARSRAGIQAQASLTPAYAPDIANEGIADRRGATWPGVALVRYDLAFARTLDRLLARSRGDVNGLYSDCVRPRGPRGDSAIRSAPSHSLWLRNYCVGCLIEHQHGTRRTVESQPANAFAQANRDSVMGNRAERRSLATVHLLAFSLLGYRT